MAAAVSSRCWSVTIALRRIASPLRVCWREIGQEAIWCKPRISIPNNGHRNYPYLLRRLTIDRPDQVWCSDITNVPMSRDHAYPCAVMDWHSRKLLGWSLSSTMGTDLCLEALEMALKFTGKVPENFNTDEGYQFTSSEWTGKLSDLGVKISMDGKSRRMDRLGAPTSSSSGYGGA